VRILQNLSIPCLDSNWHTNHIWLLKIQAIPETELATQSSSDRFKGPSAIIIKFLYTSCTYCSAYACKAIGTRTVTSNFLKHKKFLKPLANWFFSARVKGASNLKELLKQDNESPSWERIDSLLWQHKSFVPFTCTFTWWTNCPPHDLKATTTRTASYDSWNTSTSWNLYHRSSMEGNRLTQIIGVKRMSWRLKTFAKSAI
jgi:hypothetical protein